MDIPAGFVLENAGAAGADGDGEGMPALPPGFVLEKPTPKPAAKTPGFLERAADLVTGHLRTEFPNAPEFRRAAIEAGNQSPQDITAGREPEWTPDQLARANITSDTKAQIDILKKQIPGLKVQQDKHGNVMLRTPQMTEWAYLNRPGLSGQDIEELGTQTLATLPFLGAAGTGKTVLQRAATGGLGMGAAEVEKEILAKLQGSEQQKSLTDLGKDVALGAALAPGVPSAIVGSVMDVGKAAVSPITNQVRKIVNPQAEAERRVAETYKGNLRDMAYASEAAPGDAARRVINGGPDPANMSPERLQNLAANQIQVRDFATGGTSADTALIDIMGEKGRALARSAANTDTGARDQLNQFVNRRFENQAPRIQAAIEDIGGGDLAGRSRDALMEMAYETRGPIYRAVFENGRRGVQMNHELLALTEAPAVQDAMRRADVLIQNKAAAGRLHTAAVAPDGRTRTLEYWDLVKRELGDMYTQIADRRPGEAGDILALQRRLIERLDGQFPAYEGARGHAMRIFNANNALDAGESFARGRTPIAEAGRAFGELTETEQRLFRHGFVSEKLRQVNTVGDRRNLATSIMGSPETREQFEMVLGSRNMRLLQASLHSENLFDLARTAVQGNSTTARQLMELGLAGGVGLSVSGFDPSNPAGLLAAVLTKFGVARANSHLDARVAQHVAQLLTSRDPQAIRRGAQTIAGHKDLFEAVRRADEALAGIGRNIAISEISP